MAKSEARTIWRHSRVYALGNLLNRSAGLVLLPVYLHMLSPAEYGLYALLVATTEIVGVVLGMGWGNALIRFHVDCRDERERREVVATAFIAIAAVVAVFSGLAPWAGEAASRLVRGASDDDQLFAVAFWGLAFTTLLTVEMQLLLARKLPWTFLFVSVAKTGTFLGFNILFVVGLEAGVLGIAWGTLCSAALIAAPWLVLTLWRTGPAFSRRRAGAMARFGMPLVPAVLMDTGLGAVDKYIVNMMLGAGPVGGYALGDRLGHLLRMFVTMPFVQIWLVRRLETLDDDDPRRNAAFSQIFVFFVVVVTSAALGLSLFAPEVIRLVADPAYAEVAWVVPAFALAQVALALRFNFEIGIYHAKKTGRLAFIAGSTLVLAPVLLYLGIDSFGLAGGAAAYAAINFLRAAATAVVVGRISNILDAFPWRAMTAIVAWAVICAGAALWMFGISVGVTAFLGKCVVMSVFVAATAGSLLIQLRRRRPIEEADARDGLDA